jgi:uncharacterized membrane protein
LPQASRRSDSMEAKIGQYWLNRVGIVAVLIGVSYFLKYAFENNWIGPRGRIVIGLLAGIALVLWSEQFRKNKHEVFSYSLKAVGIGTLYLSLWGAFLVYHLIPAATAFLNGVGGSGAYTWTILSGNLPAGLTLTAPDSTIEQLQGQATQLGTYNFVMQLTDSSIPPYVLRKAKRWS